MVLRWLGGRWKGGVGHKSLFVDDDGEMGQLFRTRIDLEDHRAILTPAYHEIWPVICWVSPNPNLMDVQIQGRQTIGVVR